MLPTTKAGAGPVDEAAKMATASDPVTILYRNWRGEVGPRRIRYGAEHPALLSEWFGSSEWHPEPQWLFCAFDLDKGAYRDFARAGVLAWGQEAVDAALAASSSANAAAAEALRGISDDFMTSESHHPGYVLIPAGKFDRLRVAEQALSAALAPPAAVSREVIAQAIVGPHRPVPPNSSYSLEQLRAVRWAQATRAEQLDALNAADAVLEAVALAPPAAVPESVRRLSEAQIADLAAALDSLSDAAERWKNHGGDQAHRILPLIHPSFTAVYEAYKPLRGTLALASSGRTDTPPASAGAVPPGWRLVPDEATDAMMDAAGKCLEDGLDRSLAGGEGPHLSDIWRAYRDAAPATPEPAAGGEREALDDSQSLLAAIYHVGPDEGFWKTEKLSEQIAEQMSHNRSLLSASTADGETAGERLSGKDIRQVADEIWCPPHDAAGERLMEARDFNAGIRRLKEALLSKLSVRAELRRTPPTPNRPDAGAGAEEGR